MRLTDVENNEYWICIEDIFKVESSKSLDGYWHVVIYHQFEESFILNDSEYQKLINYFNMFGNTNWGEDYDS